MVLVVLFPFHWLMSAKKCHPEPFRWAPCRGDVLCWPYAYLIQSLGYMLTSMRKSRRNALHIVASYLPHACDRPAHISRSGWYQFRFFPPVCSLTMNIIRYSMAGT